MKNKQKITSHQYISELVKIQNAVKGVQLKAGSRKERLAQMRSIFAQAPKITDTLQANHGSL